MSLTLDETATRDLFADGAGNLAFALDVPGAANATSLILKARVEAQRNEMRYAIDQGMPTRTTAWDTFNPKQYEAAWRAIALATENVTGVAEFDMHLDDNTLNYAATITTTFGTGTVSAQ
jgi:hypothetical protein